ncbi:MAG: hypothetical protein JWQ09_5531 [Segetibacter sp.]|nr:hypothetical protein [Segetibacter sp.]
MIIINFEETYEPMEVAEDFSFMTFNTVDKHGATVLIKIEIKPLENSLLSNVSNLAFGPLNADDIINDAAKIPHENPSKGFSTILLFCLAYLNQFPRRTIGLDGSNEVRAYLYHRMFLTNKDYLEEYFVSIGVDWYVRLLRSGDVERDADGHPHFKPKPEPFDYARIRDLYRYYMFHLRQ